MLDMLLDQEGLEVDPVDRLEADIPLHKAVRFVNGLGKDEWEAGASLVELLLDAGADPRFVLVPFSSPILFPSLASSSLLLFSFLLRALEFWQLVNILGEIGNFQIWLAGYAGYAIHWGEFLTHTCPS